MLPLLTRSTRVHLRRTWDRSKSSAGISQHCTGSTFVPFRGARSGPQHRLGLKSFPIATYALCLTNVPALMKFISSTSHNTIKIEKKIKRKLSKRREDK